MDEVSKVLDVLGTLSSRFTEQNYIDKVIEFEQFLEVMNIDVRKKQILGERTETSIQTVFVNQYS